jgi:hypothetical protein
LVVLLPRTAKNKSRGFNIKKIIPGIDNINVKRLRYRKFLILKNFMYFIKKNGNKIT